MTDERTKLTYMNEITLLINSTGRGLGWILSPSEWLKSPHAETGAKSIWFQHIQSDECIHEILQNRTISTFLHAPETTAVAKSSHF